MSNDENRMKRSKRFANDRRGASAIEFALIAPLFFLLVFALLEFGLYFMEKQIADRAVSMMSDSIQKNAGDEVKLTNIAYKSGTSFMNLNPLDPLNQVAGKPVNYICAQSYSDRATAENSQCTGKTWVTSPPIGVLTSYYVTVRAKALKKLELPFSDYFPPIDSYSVVLVSPKPVPTGAVVAFSQTSCPPGWHDASYMRGRSVVGANGSFGGVGGAGGNTNGKFQLQVENLPHHKHGGLYNDGGHGDHSNLEQDPSFDSDDTKQTDNCPDCKDEEFSTMDPYYTLLYCEKD